MHGKLTRARRLCGFSLLEQLIAIAILSAGLLGTARLFAEALRSLRDNMQQRTAIVLGENLIDIVAAAQAARVPVARRCTIGAGVCLDDARAQAQLDAWHTQLRAALPLARAQLQIAVDAATNTVSLGIAWPDSRGLPAVRRLERVVRR